MQWTKIWYVIPFNCTVILISNSCEFHETPWRWNNRWSSFYGLAWNFSMEFHGKCPNPPWKISMEIFPWNSMETGVLILHGIPWHPFPWKISECSVEIFSMEIQGEISMEFHGNWCPNPPRNSLEVFHTGNLSFNRRDGRRSFDWSFWKSRQNEFSTTTTTTHLELYYKKKSYT